MRWHKKELLLILILIICVGLTNPIWSQKQSSTKLQDYITTMEQLAKESSVDSFKIVINEMPAHKFKNLLKKMYEAYDEDASGLGVYQDTKHRSFNDQYKEWLKNKNGQDPRKSGSWIPERYIFDRASKDISFTLSGELKVAYFLRVHTTAVKHVKQQKGNLIGAPMTIIDAAVEKVYKGNPKFKVHDNIEFYFYDSWVGSLGGVDWFKSGKDYFVPLEPRYNEEEGELIALVMYLDNSKGCYPIENEQMKDGNNFFGYGTNVPMNVFDKKFQSQINEIKSW